jgi:hypothetical protein
MPLLLPTKDGVAVPGKTAIRNPSMQCNQAHQSQRSRAVSRSQGQATLPLLLPTSRKDGVAVPGKPAIRNPSMQCPL